jgi:outer membrane protein OmpA-like peptidoglycan-associated protein
MCLVLFMLGGWVMISGQTEKPFEKDPGLEKLIKKGISYRKQGSFEKAIRQFDKVLERSPHYLPAMIEKASVYYQFNDLFKASQELENVNAIDSTYNVEIHFSLGQIYEQTGRRKAAVRSFKSYINNTDAGNRNHQKALDNIKRLNFIIQAMANPVPFDPYDPGPAINTPAPEYLATTDIKGEFMVFTRRINAQEDLYYSTKKSGEWTTALPIVELNTPYNEAAHCISPEGTELYFTKCEQRFTYGSCDIFVSKKNGQSWSDPENLGKTVNSASWDSQPVISADGNTLYFSSTRPGGYGGRDIWRTEKNRNGKWSAPVNAGQLINTNKNEESPFLHPDGKHLYFMSDGHTGMGGYDLFVSKNIQGNWGQPKNLGYPINTENDEGAIRVAPDGRTAYFSSDRPDLDVNEERNLNIYAFTLYDSIKSNPVSYVEGLVRDKQSKKPLSVEMAVFNNQPVAWIRDIVTGINGDFILALQPGKNYNLAIDEPGYVFHSENFNLSEKKSIDRPLSVLIELTPVVKQIEITGDIAATGEEFILKNVFFDSGSAVLDTVQSAVELNNMIKFLERNDRLKILIEGHTDSVGSDEDNMILSTKRAKAVMEYLVNGGVSSARIQCKGYGESRPLESNMTDSGRQLNRRTSFKIIEQ